MTIFLSLLFLFLVVATFVAIGRLTVPAHLRAPVHTDLVHALRRGVVAVDSSAGTYITTRAAHR